MKPMEPMKPMKPMKPMEPMKFEPVERWWPEELGEPNSSGSQNDVKYAYFSTARRLLLQDGTRISTYDTGEHDIRGVSQASDAAHATFTSDHGVVKVSELKQI